MKEKLKYNFLHIIPLQYFKFYDCFLLCCAQGRHFFRNNKCLTGASESHFVRGGGKIKKGSFFKKGS